MLSESRIAGLNQPGPGPSLGSKPESPGRHESVVRVLSSAGRRRRLLAAAPAPGESTILAGDDDLVSRRPVGRLVLVTVTDRPSQRRSQACLMSPEPTSDSESGGGPGLVSGVTQPGSSVSQIAGHSRRNHAMVSKVLVARVSPGLQCQRKPCLGGSPERRVRAFKLSQVP